MPLEDKTHRSSSVGRLCWRRRTSNIKVKSCVSREGLSSKMGQLLMMMAVVNDDPLLSKMQQLSMMMAIVNDGIVCRREIKDVREQ